MNYLDTYLKTMGDLRPYLHCNQPTRRLRLDARTLALVVADPALCGHEFKRGAGLTRLGRPSILFRAVGGKWEPYGTGPGDYEHGGVRVAIAKRLFVHEPSKRALRDAIYETTIA